MVVAYTVTAAVAADERQTADDIPVHQKPFHPLLRYLGMGDDQRTATSFYDNCTIIYVHMVLLVRIRITKDLDLILNVTILFQSKLSHRALALLLSFHVICSTMHCKPILTDDFFHPSFLL